MLPDLVRDPLVLRQEYFARNLQMVGAFHDAGVPFMAGTGFSLHDELANFVEAVFTPMEALETATSNPAVFLGMKASIGSIEAGKFADLLLLGANPLKNIRNTEKIKVVIAHGQVLDRAALDEILRKVESAASVRRSTTNFQSSENTEQGYR